MFEDYTNKTVDCPGNSFCSIVTVVIKKEKTVAIYYGFPFTWRLELLLDALPNLFAFFKVSYMPRKSDVDRSDGCRYAVSALLKRI